MPDAAALCMDCGICCSGTLFSAVSLDTESLIAARHHRLPVLETSDGGKLAHPCAALRGVLCAIYEERPESCADFTCALWAQVDDEEVTHDKARDIIEETRRVRARVYDVIGEMPWWSALGELRQAAGGASPRWADEHETIGDDLERLEKLVKEHFWG